MFLWPLMMHKVRDLEKGKAPIDWARLPSMNEKSISLLEDTTSEKRVTRVPEAIFSFLSCSFVGDKDESYARDLGNPEKAACSHVGPTLDKRLPVQVNFVIPSMSNLGLLRNYDSWAFDSSGPSKSTGDEIFAPIAKSGPCRCVQNKCTCSVLRP